MTAGRRVLWLVFAVAFNALAAQEVQHHGLVFEQWVRDAFFDGYRPESYTQKWDIPAAANRAHGHLPVNPKAAYVVYDLDTGSVELRRLDYDIATAQAKIRAAGLPERLADRLEFGK